MMVNRFAHLEDYAEAQNVEVPTQKQVAYVPKSAMKHTMPAAFVKKPKQEFAPRPENSAFQMNRSEGRREGRLGPMSENSAFQMTRGGNEGRLGPMSENSAFQMNRGGEGRRQMEENGAFQMNRRGNGMNDNPAFAAKKRRDDYEQYNYVIPEPPKPKEITEADIQSEEFFPSLGSPTPSATGTKTPSATTTATNTPKAAWGSAQAGQKVQPLTASTSFKDLVKKAAEKTEQEKKEAEEKKRIQDEKDRQRKHTRIIALNIRAPGLKPQMSYDDFAGTEEEDLSTRTPYYSRIEEDDEDIGLDEDDN